MNFEHSVIIHQPAEKVFEFVSNLRNNSKWQTDILVLELTSENQSGLGAAYRCVNQFMGKQIESEGVISHYAPGKEYRIQMKIGKFAGECRMIFEPLEDATKLTASGQIDTQYFRILKMIAKRKINQQIRKDMAKLKYILENGRTA